MKERKKERKRKKRFINEMEKQSSGNGGRPSFSSYEKKLITIKN